MSSGSETVVSEPHPAKGLPLLVVVVVGDRQVAEHGGRGQVRAGGERAASEQGDVSGTVTSVSPVQLENVHSGSVVSVEGNSGIDVSAVQLEKTEVPSVVSECGSVIEVSFVQLENAPVPIVAHLRGS